MTIAERLHAIVDHLPPSASVILPAGVLREWLGEEGDAGTSCDDESIADLTVDEAAAVMRRKPSTVRGWCAANKIEGAYRLNGREWRIPRTSLRTYQEAQARTHAPPRLRILRDDADDPDLSDWRAHRPRQRAHRPRQVS